MEIFFQDIPVFPVNFHLSYRKICRNVLESDRPVKRSTPDPVVLVDHVIFCSVFLSVCCSRCYCQCIPPRHTHHPCCPFHKLSASTQHNSLLQHKSSYQKVSTGSGSQPLTTCSCITTSYRRQSF